MLTSNFLRHSPPAFLLQSVWFFFLDAVLPVRLFSTTNKTFQPDESLDFDSLVLIIVSVAADTSRSICDTVNKNTTIKQNNETEALIVNGIV